MKNDIIFSEEKVRIRKKIMVDTSIRNLFCTLGCFLLMLFWARRHRGASQHLRIISGLESGSEPR